MSQQTLLTRVLFPRVLASVRAGGFAMSVVLGVFGLAMLVSLLSPVRAAAAADSTLNFQARLENTAGNIVPDGNYNIQFNLYNVPSGGTSLWTETYQNSNSQGVTVKNGYVSVSLGSITAFPTTINWDQDLYATMNIGGTSTGASPTYDGEMNPRLHLTAVPYAFRAGQLAQYNAGNGFTSMLSLIQPTSGNQTFQVPDQGAAGTYSICIANSSACGFALSSGNTNYIQNQLNSAQTSSNFWVDGTGRAGTALQAPVLDTASATGLTVGGTNATSITFGKSSGTVNVTTNFYGITTFRDNSDSSSAFRVQNSAGVNIFAVDTSSYKVIINDTVQTANTSTASSPSNNITLMSGNASGSTSNSGAVRIDTGTATGTTGIIKIGDTNASGITLGHGSVGLSIPAANSLSLGSASAANGSIVFQNSTNANILTLQSGAVSSNFTLTLPVGDGVNGNCLQTNGAGTLSFGSCTGSPGSNAANMSLSNLATVAINTSLLPGVAAGIDLGSTTLPFGKIYVAGTSANPGTNNFVITGTATAARTITLPDASGIVCISTGNCSGASATLQGAYTNSTGGTTPEIKLNATQGAVDIQDADTSIAGDLLNVRDSNSSGLGNRILTVNSNAKVGINLGSGTSASADLSFGDGANRTINVLTRSTNVGGNSLSIQAGNGGAGANAVTGGALVLQGGNAGGTTGNVNGGDVRIYGGTPVNTGLAGNVVLAYTGSAAQGNVAIGQATAAYRLDIAGDVNLSSGSAYRINGTSICSASGCAPASGSTNYIQNQNAVTQTANFTISGTGIAGVLQAGTFDTATATTLNLGTTNANAVNIATNASVHTIAIGNGAAVQGITIGSANSTSSLMLQAGTGNLQLQTQGGTLGIGNNAVAQTIAIGNSIGATGVTIAAGTAGVSLGNSGIANILQIGNTTGSVAQTINIGNNATASSSGTLNVGSLIGASTTTLQAGTGNINLNTNQAGAGIVVKTVTNNSVTAFQIQNAAGAAMMTVDTTTNKITVGNGSNTVTLNPVFDSANGIYGGTARPVKKISLSAEYPSAVLDAANDGTCAGANTGSMTSGFTGFATPSAVHSYYKWTTSSATTQCYDVVVRITLPTDFSGWSSAPTLTGLSSDGTAALNVEVRDTTATVDTSNYAALTLGTNTWTTSTLSGLTGTYTAGGVMTVRLRMSAINNDYVQAGQLVLPYYSKF